MDRIEDGWVYLEGPASGGWLEERFEDASTFTIEDLIAELMESEPELVEEDGLISSYATPPTEDIIVQPAHYQMAIQPAEFILRNGLDWTTGDVISYLCRAGVKIYPGKTDAESAIIDLRKAIQHIEMKIEHIEAHGL